MKIIVVINKIDKKDARVDYVINKLHDLFLDMATDPEQLEFPVFYAIAREGKAWAEMPADFNEKADLSPIFEDILRHISAPEDRSTEPFQMLVSTLDRDNFQGKYAIGRITRGIVKPGMAVTLMHNEKSENAKVEKVFVSRGLKRVEVPEAGSGEIVALTGVANAGIGSTIADANHPEALPTIVIEEPTLKMSVGANTSPFAGKEGKFVTSRNILDRINKELETNVSLKMTPGTDGDYILSGRGELHLSVFIETLRREGFELQVGKPHVITKEIDGVKSEPVEELTIDVSADSVGPVTSEVGRRKGKLLSQEDNGDGSTRLIFEITTRGMIGLRNQLLTISKGTAVMSSMFIDYAPMTGEIISTRNGVLIASDPGKALGYGLNIAQGRGIVFIHPQTQVYQGMIVGLNSRENDIDINVTKSKNLTNVRASGSDDALNLTPPTIFSLEQALDFLEDDELLEVTPTSLRLRKKYLNPNDRKRNK
jgi:GTP-binding protein